MIEAAVKRAIDRCGPRILQEKDLLFNCLEDLMPDDREALCGFSSLYDNRTGKLLFDLYTAEKDKKPSYRSELESYLKRRIEYQAGSELLNLLNSREFFGVFGDGENGMENKSDAFVKIKERNGINSSQAGKTKIQESSNINKIDEFVWNGLESGNCYEFGVYPYWQNGTREKIVWRVLHIKGNRALLISNKILDTLPFELVMDSIQGQQKVLLEEWLNTFFYTQAFSKYEMARLILNEDTRQLISLPSLQEIRNFFSDDPEAVIKTYNQGKAKALPTPYAVERGTEVSMSKRYAFWWLRDYIKESKRVLCINRNGSIYEAGKETGSKVGVRPIIWLREN